MVQNDYCNLFDFSSKCGVCFKLLVVIIMNRAEMPQKRKALCPKHDIELLAAAASGDGQACIQPCHAIALSNDDTIVPQYVESSALKWGKS